MAKNVYSITSLITSKSYNFCIWTLIWNMKCQYVWFMAINDKTNQSPFQCNNQKSYAKLKVPTIGPCIPPFKYPMSMHVLSKTLFIILTSYKFCMSTVVMKLEMIAWFITSNDHMRQFLIWSDGQKFICGVENAFNVAT